MTEIILQYLEKNKYFITEEDLKRKLEIKGEEQTESFLSALKDLVGSLSSSVGRPKN